MLHNKKISQRRVLLFDHIGGQGFRTMPSTESEPCRPPIPLTPSLVDDMPSEQVADIRRNEWTACFGIAGRHGSDYADWDRVSAGEARLSPTNSFLRLRCR